MLTGAALSLVGGFLLVALALFTSISSMMMAGPRVYARMAADGLLPAIFEGGADVPTVAVLAQAALAVLGVATLFGWVGV